MIYRDVRRFQKTEVDNHQIRKVAKNLHVLLLSSAESVQLDSQIQKVNHIVECCGCFMIHGLFVACGRRRSVILLLWPGYGLFHLGLEILFQRETLTP